MKKILYTFSIILVFTTFCFSQNINSVKLNNNTAKSFSSSFLQNMESLQEQSKAQGSNLNLIKDTHRKARDFFRKDLNIYLSGGLTFSNDFRDSFKDYLESNDYGINSGRLNFLAFEGGVELKIIKRLYVYGRYKLSNTKIEMKYSDTDKKDSLCKMHTIGIDTRYYFSENVTYAWAICGGLNMNTFSPFTPDFEVESAGIGYNISLIFLTQIYNFISGGFEVGYSRNPIRVNQYPNSIPQDLGVKNFGGLITNLVINLALLNY